MGALEGTRIVSPEVAQIWSLNGALPKEERDPLLEGLFLVKPHAVALLPVSEQGRPWERRCRSTLGQVFRVGDVFEGVVNQRNDLFGIAAAVVKALTVQTVN